MLPLHTCARVRGVWGKAIVKILTAEEARGSDVDPSRCLIWRNSAERPRDWSTALRWAGVVSNHAINEKDAFNAAIILDRIETPGAIAPGDVVRLIEGSPRVSVLYRRGSNSNTLFATERCNSFCVMCSQPPRDVDDKWLVDEMIDTIPLIDRTEVQLGISGGEPTLLGDDLLVVLHQAQRHLPETGLHILSNGRRFSDRDFARCVCAVRHRNLTWGIPVYSDCPEIHDYIVQAEGAWDETLAGIYNLAKFNAIVEIRVVVQRANIERLGELAYFIFRNLTFAKHIAFMGLEPIGFARANYDRIWIDPVDCDDALKDAAFFLANRGMTVSLYNFPLCTLPVELWPIAQKSISDWKNTYLTECATCSVRDRCCGFFASIDQRWTSRGIRPMSASGALGMPRKAGATHEMA